MTITDWRLKGQWVENCSCAFGCPCNFDAPPTHEICHAIFGMNITEGNFGSIRLGGLKFLLVLHFPGPPHYGNGTMQPIIDAISTPHQRQALLEILSGKHAEPGTIFNVFSLLTARQLDALFSPIEFSFDLPKRRARIAAEGALVTKVEPIRNPVTGAEHEIRVMMPESVGYSGMEVAAARIESTAGIKFIVPEGHGSLALVEHTAQGVAA